MSGVRVDLHGLLVRQIEDGVAYGLSRCFKYVDTPITPDDVPRMREAESVIVEAIINSIYEYMDFSTGEENGD